MPATSLPTDTPVPILTASDLREGDILLSSTDEMVSRLIKLFDRSKYSHAALYSTEGVYESLFEGVVCNPLAKSLEGCTLVDVYRHKEGPTAEQIRTVLATARGITEEKSKYGFLAGALLGLISIQRAVGPLLTHEAEARNLIDQATQQLHAWGQGRRHYICSDFVATCLKSAGPGAQLEIALRGQVFMDFDEVTMPDGSPLTRPDRELLKALLRVNHPGELVPTSQAGIQMMPFGEPDPQPYSLVLSFVTPSDIARAQNLRHIGTLKLN